MSLEVQDKPTDGNIFFYLYGKHELMNSTKTGIVLKSKHTYQPIRKYPNTVTFLETE